MNNLLDRTVVATVDKQVKSESFMNPTQPQRSHGKSKQNATGTIKCGKCLRYLSICLFVLPLITLVAAIVFLFTSIEQFFQGLKTIYVNTECLKALLSVEGLVGFPLSYIISSKASKIRGFAFDDIIWYHFPQYGYVFAFQAVAVILGFCSFYAEKVTSLCLFTIVALLCAIYTAYMVTCLVFSEKCKTFLAKTYLLWHLENSNKHNTHAIMDYCRYLSEKYEDTFLAASIALHYDESDLHSDSKSEIARFYKDILLVLTSNARKKQAEVCTKNSSTDGVRLSSAKNILEDDDTKEFKAFFDVCGYTAKNDPTQSLELIKKHPLECAILFEIPQFNENFISIKNNLLPLIEMWEGLLGKEKDSKKQAAVIFAVLYQSIPTQELVGQMRFIEISLLIYFARHTIQNGQTQEGNGWEQTMLLLYHCDTIATQTIETERRSRKENQEVYDAKIKKVFKDISITAYAFAVLSQASTSTEIPLELIASILTLFSWRSSEKLREESALQYLCYANIVLTNVCMPDQSKMTPPELYLALPHIVRALLCEVNKEKC